MKLNEITHDKETIDTILRRYKVRHFTINDDLIVDVDGSIMLNEIQATELPFKFGYIAGDFHLFNCPYLKTLKGFPIEVGRETNKTGRFEVFGCQSLMSLRGCPKVVHGEVIIEKCPEIKDYLLLLKIKEVTSIKISTKFQNPKDKKLNDILNKYLGTRDLMTAQEELIEAGLEEYTRL